VHVLGAALAEGEGGIRRARLALDAPIDIVVTEYRPHEIAGAAADAALSMTVAPAEAAEAPIRAEILVDRSGSINEPCTGHREGPVATKHAILVADLGSAARRLEATDETRLWEYAIRPRFAGRGARGPNSKACSLG